MNLKKAICIMALLIPVLVGCSDNLISNNSDKTQTAQEDSIWKTYYYVDNFQEPTSEQYITNTQVISGKFSNSATTNSELDAKIVVDKKNLYIILWEYGHNQVKTNSLQEYNIEIKKADGNMLYVSGQLFSDRISINSVYYRLDGTILRDHKQEVIDALFETGTVSFYLSPKESSSTSYLFSVETSNFSDEYNSLFE